MRTLLERQVTDPASPFRGIVPNEVGLHWAGPAGGAVETLTASFIHPRSRYHDDRALLERIRPAAGFLKRAQSPDGNIDLPIANFNSPPDTASSCTTSGSCGHRTAARTRGDHANPRAVPRQSRRRHGREEITRILQPFLVKAADGEVVSEISRRQDQFTRGTVAGY